MSLLDNNPFSFIFGTKPGGGVPTYGQLQMRRKIAESLLGQKSRYPKTFGEGLSAIGEAIGERGMMNKLDAMDQAYEGQTGPEYNRVMGLPAAPMTKPMSYAPEDAGTGPVAAAAITSGDPWAARSAAIGGIESGGAKDPYSLMGAATRTGDRAHGKYQVMGANVPEWTKAATGTAMTPQQFLASPDAQEAVFKHRFGGYVDKYGEEGAAKAWYGGERGMNNPNATDVHGRLTVRGYGQDYLKRLGPQSDAGPVVDPGLNQSVALNQAEPPAPSGPPMAFSGAPASDAPPVGMPMAGQQPPPPDARAAIAGALAPKPPPVAAPPVPNPPAPVQIAQAPPQQQIRAPGREPTPPPAPQATSQMNDIAVLSGKLDPNDPRQRGLQMRYQQLQANQQADYTQKLEEYKHKRNRWEAAPEKELTMQKTQQEVIKATQEAEELTRTGGLGSKALIEPVVKNQEKVAGIPAAIQSLRAARATIETGTFTGIDAEQKLAIAKTKSAVASLLGISYDDPRIANTEAYRANVAPLVAQARASIAGNANISDADIEMALKASAGAITLDAKSYPKILDAIERINVAAAIGHQGKVLAAAAGNETAAQRLQGVYGLPMEEIIPPRIIERLKKSPELASEFDKTFKTPGLARKILGQ